MGVNVRQGHEKQRPKSQSHLGAIFVAITALVALQKDITSPAYSSQISQVLWALLAIIAFCAMLYGFGYIHIPAQYYQYRDDALICYSHAVNLVDYGFVGVNPSGERVEGYSTPLLFICYWVYYMLSGGSFQTYADLQTYGLTAIMGLLLYGISPAKGWRGVLAVALAALLLSQHTRWLQWHASGMENPLSETAMLGTIYAILQGVQGRARLWHAWPYALLGLARVEFLFYLVPLLALYSLFLWQKEEELSGILHLKVSKNMQKALASILAGLLAVGVVHGIRIAYFGAFQPNTGIAQHLDLVMQLKWLSGKEDWYLAKAGDSVLQMLAYNGAIFGAMALGLYTICTGERLKEYGLLLLIVVLLTITHGLLFSANRLDAMRYGTHLGPLCCLALPLFVFSIAKKYSVVGWFFAAACLPLCFFFTRHSAVAAAETCCNFETFTPLVAQIEQFGKKESLPRPALGNPDLGIVSIGKKFNVIDLANIGSSVMAQLSFADPLRKHYLFYYAAPDVVEAHGHWVGTQQDYFRDYRFGELYNQVSSDFSSVAGLSGGVFHRRDILKNSHCAERRWIDSVNQYLKIKKDCHGLAWMVERELRQPDSILLQHTYVARTLFRYLPDIKKLPGYFYIFKALRNSRTYAYDSLLLASGNMSSYAAKAVPELSKSLLCQIFESKVPIHNATIEQCTLSEKPTVLQGELGFYIKQGVLVIIGTEKIIKGLPFYGAALLVGPDGLELKRVVFSPRIEYGSLGNGAAMVVRELPFAPPGHKIVLDIPGDVFKVEKQF